MVFWCRGMRVFSFSLLGLVFKEEELAVVVALAVFPAGVEPAAFVGCVLLHLAAGGGLTGIAVACGLLEFMSKVVLEGPTYRAMCRL